MTEHRPIGDNDGQSAPPCRPLPTGATIRALAIGRLSPGPRRRAGCAAAVRGNLDVAARPAQERAGRPRRCGNGVSARRSASYHGALMGRHAVDGGGVVGRAVVICLGLAAQLSGCSGGTSSTGGVDAAAGVGGGGLSGTGGRGGTGGAGAQGGAGGRSATGGGGGTAGAGGVGGTGGGGGSPQCTTFSIPSCTGTSNPYATNGWVAEGAWKGYADPYLAGFGSLIDAPPDFDTAGSSLCTAGSIGATSDVQTQAGIEWNVNQAMTTGAPAMSVTPTGTGLSIDGPGTTTAMRVNLTDGTTTWCAYLPAAGGGTIPWSSFNTECWPGGQGTPYTMQPFVKVQVAAVANETDPTCFCFCIVSIAPAS